MKIYAKLLNDHVCNKLVRNKVPAIMEKKCEYTVTKVLTDEEYYNALRNKLCEETKELIGTDNERDILEGCADLLQVLEDIIKLEGYTKEDLYKTKLKKESRLGSFDEKIFLKKVVK